VLRDDGLLEPERLLQFLDGALAAGEDFEDADPDRVGEGAEELRLERLEMRDSQGMQYMNI
jgi:hypothetical protein